MLNQNKHRRYMYDILVDISNSPLKNYIAFKWWTLCFFVYGLDRFSTDLDFDIIKDNKNITTWMKDILKKYGNIKDEYDKKFTNFFLLDYGADNQNIKIELSKKKQKNDKYETINFFGSNLLAMTKDCIFANKLVALSQRYKNRDLFDIHFFYKNHFPINEDLILERTGWGYVNLLEEIKAEIPQKYSKNSLLAEMWELVTEKQKYFIKNKLIKEVIWLIDFEIFNNSQK